MRDVKRIIEQKHDENERKRAPLLKREVSLELHWYAAKYFCAVEAQNEHADNRENCTESDLVVGIRWVHVRDMEVY